MTRNILPRKSRKIGEEIGTIATRKYSPADPGNPEIRGAIWGGLLRKHPRRVALWGFAPMGTLVVFHGDQLYITLLGGEYKPGRRLVGGVQPPPCPPH